ncbi:MAG TPA: VWA domain-containing protein [Polyangiaceae bacterium]
MFVPFLFELRKRKVKVGLQEAMALARALGMNLHDTSLDGFYHVARALCVHSEADLDAFDEAFLACFRGVEAQSLDLVKELEQWLSDPRARKDLSPEELAMLQNLDLEELRRLFEERLREQKERHDGGNKWIGTGGTSPFGAHGAHPTGVRVGPKGGGRSAMAVADARVYRPYRSDLVLDVRQIEVALRKLRAFHREGADLELDLEATIDETAKNAGELEVVLRPPRRPNVRVLLLMDVGGSMDPYAQLVSQLFSAAKRASNFRELKTYYFHNCVYGRVYETESFRDPVIVRDLLLHCTREWKLVMVGDAAMHPAELLGGGDWYASRDEIGGEAMHGIRWMQLLADHFERGVWLNPDPPNYWRGGTAEMLSTVFQMFPLTLEGLGDAMAHLSKGAPRRR